MFVIATGQFDHLHEYNAGNFRKFLQIPTFLSILGSFIAFLLSKLIIPWNKILRRRSG